MLKYKLSGWVKKVAVTACFLPLLMGCGVLKQKKTEYPTEKEKIVYVIKDSLRIKDSVIFIKVPQERIRVVCPSVDTLRMETSVAFTKVYLDTCKRQLRGTLQNKPVKLDKDIQIVYKDKIVEKKITKEVPVPYEVVKEVNKIPKWCWYSIGVNILFIFGIFLLIKLK